LNKVLERKYSTSTAILQSVDIKNKGKGRKRIIHKPCKIDLINIPAK